jgi:hypothetical protein
VKLAKVLLLVSGILAVGLGVAMMVAAKPFLESQGFVVDAKIAVIGQAQGAVLLGLGAINLLVARVTDPAALRAGAAGNIVVHLAALAVNVHALAADLVGSSVRGDAGGHTIFAVAFAIAWYRLRDPKSRATRRSFS